MKDCLSKVLWAGWKQFSIYRAMERLPERCSQAFLLHRTSGLSYSEIAQELGVSVSSVEKYILQALKHCRAALAMYYEDKDPGKETGQEPGDDG